MRALVVGGTGFLGAPVVRALQRRGHDVAVLHRGSGAAPQGSGEAGGTAGGGRVPELTGHPSGPPPEGVVEIRADRNRLGEAAPALRRFAPDVVIDLVLSSAAQARELMALLRGVAARVVAASSLDVYRATGVLYGNEAGGLEPLPLTEQSPLRTRLHPYPPAQIAALRGVFGWLDDDYDKIPVEREVLGHAELPGTVLRLPIVYGPRDKLHRFRPLARRIADGRANLVLGEELAGWRATRSYVEDAAEAVALAAVHPDAAGRTYNVGEPDAPSELEWTRLAARAAGWDGEVVVLPAALTPEHLRPPGNVAQHWVADSGRLRRELGWSEALPREEALRRTLEWERERPPAPDGDRRAQYAAEDSALAAMRRVT